MCPEDTLVFTLSRQSPADIQDEQVRLQARLHGSLPAEINGSFVIPPDHDTTFTRHTRSGRFKPPPVSAVHITPLSSVHQNIADRIHAECGYHIHYAMLLQEQCRENDQYAEHPQPGDEAFPPSNILLPAKSNAVHDCHIDMHAGQNIGRRIDSV